MFLVRFCFGMVIGVAAILATMIMFRTLMDATRKGADIGEKWIRKKLKLDEDEKPEETKKEVDQG